MERNDSSERTRNASSRKCGKKGKEIGRGSYGTVFLGMNNETGSLLAIKEVSFARRTPAQIRELRREINF